MLVISVGCVSPRPVFPAPGQLPSPRGDDFCTHPFAGVLSAKNSLTGDKNRPGDFERKVSKEGNYSLSLSLYLRQRGSQGILLNTCRGDRATGVSRGTMIIIFTDWGWNIRDVLPHYCHTSAARS